jgi:hypothetical protein
MKVYYVALGNGILAGSAGHAAHGGADAPVVLTGPQAAAGLVQRLACKTAGFAFVIGAL